MITEFDEASLFQFNIIIIIVIIIINIINIIINILFVLTRYWL